MNRLTLVFGGYVSLWSFRYPSPPLPYANQYPSAVICGFHFWTLDLTGISFARFVPKGASQRQRHIMYLTRSEYDRGVNTFSPEGRLFQVRRTLVVVVVAAAAAVASRFHLSEYPSS
jgi:Proteasome subunit A N-terminal signature